MAGVRAAPGSGDADLSWAAVAVDAALDAAMQGRIAAVFRGAAALAVVQASHARAGDRVAVERAQTAVDVVQAAIGDGCSVDRGLVRVHAEAGVRVVRATGVVVEAKLSAACEELTCE